MPKSRTRKEGKKNLKNFKQKAKRMSEQQNQEKSQLFPQPQWKSTDFLKVRGDFIELLEKGLNEIQSGMEKAVTALRYIITVNLYDKEKNPDGKVTLGYVWNTGEAATEKEVAEYNETMEKLKKIQEERSGVVEKGPGPLSQLVNEYGEAIPSDKNIREETVKLPVTGEPIKGDDEKDSLGEERKRIATDLNVEQLKNKTWPGEPIGKETDTSSLDV